MSKFRELVEDQVQQVIQQKEPVLLTDDIKAKVLEAVNKIDVDLEDLSSARYDSNPYGLEPHLAWGSGEWDYDEDEMFAKQIDKFIDYMKADGIYEYIDMPEEQMNDTSYINRLQTEIEVWLNSIQPNV